MLTNSQKLMVSDGAPVGLFIAQADRAQAWLDNPPKTMTRSFLDPVTEAEKTLREQFKREADALRITKMLAGQARKAVKVTPADIRGMRWDPRRNKFVPIDAPRESHKMKFDTDKPAADQASSAEVSSSDAVKEVTTMATTAKKSAAKKPAKSKAKKVVKKAAKKSGAKKAVKAKSDKPRGPGVIATIIETIGRANGASANEILEVLVKKFPDREPDSMRKTVMIQANKNAKSKERSEKRGVIYYGHK